MKNIYYRLKVLTSKLKQERQKLFFIKKNIDKYMSQNLINEDYYKHVDSYEAVAKNITELEQQFAAVSKLKFKYSLELEFEERKNKHKERTIIAALLAYEGKGIYNHYLLKRKFGDDVMDISGCARAVYVANELKKSAEKDKHKTFNLVYEMCWKKIRKMIQDDVILGKL